MWTPKRILLLAVGVLLFVGCYVAYAHQLGMVDGLPPLPTQYWPSTEEVAPTLPPRQAPLIAKTLELAFGTNCPELKQRDYPIKIEVPARGLVLATKDVTFLDDGRVCLIPLSVALFGKSRGEDGTPEINTIRGERAYLTFEHPIRNMADMGKHKIMAGEISGDIHIVNNHRTKARDDDLAVDISKGPLYYDQKKQQIWTEDYVHVLDNQSKPKPTEISGQGLVLDLIAEQPRQGPGRPVKPRQMDNVTGVKAVLLKSAVDMHLYVDGGSGFLGGPPKDGPAQSKQHAPRLGQQPAEKAHLIIKTQGPFRYDMLKDHAWFDVRPPDPRRMSKSPEIVSVVRAHDALGNDQLECDHLELQFRKKQPPPGAKVVPASAMPKKVGTPGTSSNLEIEWAHAIGGTVTLVSDAEMLNADGHDFFYDARTLTSTLKGKPMRALKEGNEIHARQMQIRNSKDGQSATALGPGRLSLLDKTTGKHHMHAQWQDVLESSRDGQYDLLHLTGNAAFLDDANGQELRADDLRVWLLPQEKQSGPAGAPKPPVAAAPDEKSKQGEHSRRPHHLIATGHVRSVSKEFNIKDAQRFVVWFHDAPPAPAGALAAQPPKAATPGQPAAAADGKMPTPADATKPPAEEKKPIDLWARSVEAHVQRVGEKNELQKVRAEGPSGTVHVVQAPAKKDEKGVDIKGDTLQLTAFPDGNYLVVTGDLARLELERMLILGPEVNIDQVANKAWVNGIGAMTIESETDFQGKKLKKPTPLTIHWNKAMVFTGPLAVFHGGILADQENARLRCQEMQVFFDKPISLKQGQKDKDKAKVRNLVCDRAAHVEDTTIENGKLVKYILLTGNVISFDNEDGTVLGSGPGEARTFQPGNDEPGVGLQPAKPQPTKPGTPKKNDEMKLTFVSYYARMDGNQKKQMARFFTNVRVLHLPSNNPHMEIDIDRLAANLPEGAMYLRCDHLEVFTRSHPQGKATQVMHAKGRVSVASQEFHGEADSVFYDEEKDQVIFNGGQNGTAILYKHKVKGAPPEMIEGRKIIYERRTGSHTGTDLKTLSGQNGG